MWTETFAAEPCNQRLTLVVAMAQLSPAVDPFSVVDPSELSDWRLPLSFMKSRHSSLSDSDEEGRAQDQAWRLKDRVCG